MTMLTAASLLLLASLLTTATPSAEVPPENGCQYTRNIGKYREAGPVDANGVPLPAGNVVCYFESPPVKTLQDFKTECDQHPECVGFSFTSSKTPRGPPPAVGAGCLKNNYSPKLFPKGNGWGDQPGYDGYDKGRWSGIEVNKWQHVCPCRCPLAWGAPFLAAITFVAACYVGAGAVVNWRLHPGMRPGWRLLPHRAFWAEVYGLVLDGVVFARKRGGWGEGRQGQRDALLAHAHGQQGGGGGGRSSPEKNVRAKEKKVKAEKGHKGASSDGGKAGERASSGQGSQRGSGNDPRGQPQEEAATPEGATAPSTESAAPGGGRWVHVS